MADPSARFVAPEGVALSIAIVSPAFLALSVIGVAARICVRLRDGVFAIDDYLLLGGTITYLADTCLAVYAATVGVGTANARLNAWLQTEAMKYYTIWILLYVAGLAQVKSSICAMIWRIGMVRRGVRVTLALLLGLVWASFLVTFAGVLLYCAPVEANWDASLLATVAGARCGSVAAMIGISHTATATTLITDVGCAVLPGVLLWKANMKTRAKLEVFTLLSVASVASISTIARAPFISHYEHPQDDLLYYVGYIVLLSNIETGIACIAASLPSVRRLYTKRRADKTTAAAADNSSKSTGYKGRTIRTIGGGLVSSGGHHADAFVIPTGNEGRSAAAVEAQGAGVWEQAHYSDSDERVLLSSDRRAALPRDMIRVDCTYAVEMELMNKDK